MHALALLCSVRTSSHALALLCSVRTSSHALALLCSVRMHYGSHALALLCIDGACVLTTPVWKPTPGYSLTDILIYSLTHIFTDFHTHWLTYSMTMIPWQRVIIPTCSDVWSYPHARMCDHTRMLGCVIIPACSDLWSYGAACSDVHVIIPTCSDVWSINQY